MKVVPFDNVNLGAVQHSFTYKNKTWGITCLVSLLLPSSELGDEPRVILGFAVKNPKDKETGEGFKHAMHRCDKFRKAYPGWRAAGVKNRRTLQELTDYLIGTPPGKVCTRVYHASLNEVQDAAVEMVREQLGTGVKVISPTSNVPINIE